MSAPVPPQPPRSVRVPRSDAAERQVRRMEKVMRLLDRVESRPSVRDNANRRRHERRHYRATAVLLPIGGSLPEARVVWTRSLSEGGMSVVATERVAVDRVTLGLRAGTQFRWMTAQVVRRRELPEQGFWEYGLKFTGRAEVPGSGAGE